MAQTAGSKVRWIEKWRERRKLERRRRSATAGPAGDRRRKADGDYDEDRLRRIGRGAFFG